MRLRSANYLYRSITHACAFLLLLKLNTFYLSHNCYRRCCPRGLGGGLGWGGDVYLHDWHFSYLILFTYFCVQLWTYSTSIRPNWGHWVLPFSQSRITSSNEMYFFLAFSTCWSDFTCNLLVIVHVLLGLVKKVVRQVEDLCFLIFFNKTWKKVKKMYKNVFSTFPDVAWRWLGRN